MTGTCWVQSLFPLLRSFIASTNYWALCVCVCVRVYIYIHMYEYKYIHTHILVDAIQLVLRNWSMRCTVYCVK